jgi:hypothetical protein
MSFMKIYRLNIRTNYICSMSTVCCEVSAKPTHKVYIGRMLTNGHQYLLGPFEKKQEKYWVWKLERNAGKFIIILSDLSINYLFYDATCPISQVRLPF